MAARGVPAPSARLTVGDVAEVSVIFTFIWEIRQLQDPASTQPKKGLEIEVGRLFAIGFSMRRRLLPFAAVVLALALPLNAYALPIVLTDGSGYATGIAGLVVDGTTFDVSFRLGSFDSLFPSPAAGSPTFWGDGDGASDAADAMASVLTAGSATANYRRVHVPYEQQVVGIVTGYGVDYSGSAWNSSGAVLILGTASNSSERFAVFSEATSSVPDAGAAASLLGLALFGVAALRRRLH